MTHPVRCPDCGEGFPPHLFVAHREKEHPPTPKTLSVAGINSETRFGTDPKE
jgi:hypothetical protein